MSVSRCHNSECHREYWRYRGDFPPRGYCSVACFLTRHKRIPKQPIEKPRDVLEAFQEHRVLAHQTRDLHAWFDCEVCERFEERYAVSMAL